MRLAVYSPAGEALPLVLTPECMQPSMAIEHEHGHMCLKGTVSLDESLLPAISHPVSPGAGDLEYVVRDEVSARALQALLDHPPESEPPGSLRIA